MSEDLTPRQQILLWELVSRGGSALQKDIRPEIKPVDREPLRKAGYVNVAKEGRGNKLSLADGGWDYIATQAPRLEGNGSKYDRSILHFVLTRVQTYAAKNNVAFADLFATREEREIDGRKASDRDDTLQRAISRAFFEIAGRPAQGNIRLSQLRGHLAHLRRDEVDAALVAMWKAGEANLMNLDNPRDIEAETAAALRTGIHTFHVVRIRE